MGENLEPKIEQENIVKQQINNDAPIDEQFNQSAEVILNNFGKTEGRLNLNEIAIDLPTKPRLEFNFSKSELPNSLVENTFDKRLVFFDCPDRGIYEAAIYTFIQELENKTPKKFEDKKVIDFRGSNEKYADQLFIDLFLEDSVRPNQIIVLDIQKLSKQFFDSLDDRLYLKETIKAKLSEKNIIIICLINYKKFKEGIQFLDHFEEYLIWEIPFLTHLLHRYQSEFLEEGLLEQRKNTLWSPENYRFYQEIKEALNKGGKNGLLKEYARREVKPDENLQEKLEELEKEKISIRKIIAKKKNPLKKYLVFLVAFFENLKDGDLYYLLNALVEDEKKLKKQVRRGYQDVLDKCHIERRSSIEKSFEDLILDFSNVDFRDDAIDYFFKRDFQFTIIQYIQLLKSGFLLDKGASRDITRNLINLIGNVSKASRGFGLKLLQCMIIAIMHNRNEVDMEVRSEDLDEYFSNKFMDYNLFDSRWRIFSDVMLEMSNHDYLQSEVKQLFHYLVNKKQHEIALLIVLKLRYSPNVDKIQWLRQLIDNGAAETKEDAFLYLVGLADSSNKLMEYLEQINTWLPAKDLEPKYHSDANKYGLKFMLGLCNYNYNYLNPNHFGQYPSKHGLLRALQLEEDNYAQNIEMVADWLFYPNVEYAWRPVNTSQPNILQVIRGRYFISISNLLENWYAVLHGLSPEPKSSENLKLFDDLLQAIIPKIKEDPLAFKILATTWTDKENYYDSQIRKWNKIKQETSNYDEQEECKEQCLVFAARRFLLVSKFRPLMLEKYKLINSTK